ncbi:hypothetical protein WG66_003751 [Moniliophthora roreri]|nr:hypothetical protein WG66_003751 [Moniliophthora roreri]
MSTTDFSPSSSSTTLPTSSPRVSRFVVQSSDVLQDARVDVLEENSDKVIWFKERFLAEHEVIEQIVHNQSSKVCWTIHRPMRGWYIRIRSPSFPPGVFIPLTPVPSSSPHHSEAAMTFISRTNLPNPLEDSVLLVQAGSSTSTVHSYPPTPPPAPALVLHPPSPPTSQSGLPKEKERLPKKLVRPSTSEFILAPYIAPASSTSFLSRVYNALRDYDRLSSNSFTLSRIAQQAPPPSVAAATSAQRLSSPLTSVKCLPLLTFHDRTSLLTVRSMTGMIEIDLAEERLLGVDTSFWIAVALTYLDFLNDRGETSLRRALLVEPMDTDSLASRLDNASIASGTVRSYVQRGSNETDNRVYQKNICDPPYFPSLNPDDEFDIFDIEISVEAAKSPQTDVVFRYRNASSTSSGRPAYKAEKTVKNRFIPGGKINIQVLRSQTWDSVKGEPIVGKPKGNIPIWEGFDINTRDAAFVATKGVILKSSTYAGAFTMTPYCGGYDPQKSRPIIHRDCLSHHFFPLYLTDFQARAPSRNKGPQKSRTPEALAKPYSGGGHFVFDCHSQGRRELLTTLYCTGYNRRHRVRTGDIALAELRLPHVGSGRADLPAWARLFKERHATLYISRRGLDAAFTGAHVNMMVPGPVEGNRYTLTLGQSQEMVISAFAIMILSIENDTIGSKKWHWMTERETLEREIGRFTDSLAVTVNRQISQLQRAG